jgi:hypothetical protein
MWIIFFQYTNNIITCYNVEVTGNATLSGDCKWFGGSFYNTLQALNITNRATVVNIFVNGRVILTEFGILTNSTIHDTSVFSGGVIAVYLNNSSSGATKTTLSNCDITSDNNIAVMCISRENGAVNIVTNNTIKSNTQIGLLVHFSSVIDDTSSICSNNSVINVGPNPAMQVYNVSQILTPPNVTVGNHIVSNNTAFSRSGAGIQLIIGTIRNCNAYSILSAGILVDSAELLSNNLAIIDCNAESRGSNGLLAMRDIYIVGGTYISRSTASNGHPIRISNSSDPLPGNYYIAGVKTLAQNTSAFAIKSDTPITARITGCIFLNENTAGTVAGIDLANITPVAVVQDAFGNIN